MRNGMMEESTEPLPVQTEDERLQVPPQALRTFIDFFAQQEQIGLERYGLLLQAANGRSAYNDTMEEMADAVKYISQLHKELQLVIAYIRSTYGANGLWKNEEFRNVISNIVFNKRILNDTDYKNLADSFIHKELTDE